MDVERVQMRRVWEAFLILLLAGAVRQLGQRCFPDRIFYHYLVYGAYVVLLVLWIRTLHRRLTQRDMKLLLTLGGIVMILWIIVRLAQETVLRDQILWKRLTGYLIHVPIVWIPLLGFFAGCRLGRGEEDRTDPRWYLLTIPACLLMGMVFTDPITHIVYVVLEGEEQPNVQFHPNWGVGLIAVWVIGVLTARVVMIFRRNRVFAQKSLFQRCAPFMEILLVLLCTAPYLANSFYMERELIEYSVLLLFIEVVSWEVYIYVGLVPVNTRHELVFRKSTVGMQILRPNGVCLTRSQNAVELTRARFEELRCSGRLVTEEGQELCIRRLDSGDYMVWQKDVSELHHLIEEQRDAAAQLQDESLLLAKELAARSEQTAIQEKNRIYNRLTEEVDSQLKLLQGLLKKEEKYGAGETGFRRICLIGTYIKQRCNLRLIEQSEGSIDRSDLDRSFRELLDNLAAVKVRGEILWDCGELGDPRLALAAYDIFWYLLEQADFRVEELRGEFLTPSQFRIELIPRDGEQTFDVTELKTHCFPGAVLEQSWESGRLLVRLWEGER